MSTHELVVAAEERPETDADDGESTQSSEQSPCCSPAEQASCCEPSAKTSCCGASPGGGCGCR